MRLVRVEVDSYEWVTEDLTERHRLEVLEVDAAGHDEQRDRPLDLAHEVGGIRVRVAGRGERPGPIAYRLTDCGGDLGGGAK